MDEEDRTKDEASSAFASYAEVVKKAVSKISPTSPRYFFDVFKDMEESHEFKMLGQIFSKAFGVKRSDAADSRLQNYFRRSGFYLDITKGKPVDIDAVFEGLWAAFNKKEIKETIIRPINFVQFPEKVIDFGAFKIQALSKDGLDSLLEQEISRIFYPHAIIDTKKLSLFWHIIEESAKIKDKEKLNELGFTIIVGEGFKVKREFPVRTIQLLALFDWGKASARPSPEKKDTDFWLEILDVPFRYVVSSDLLDSPRLSPDLLKKLTLIPRSFYAQSGEEIEVEVPDFYIDLSDSELDVLRKIVEIAHDFFESINLQKCDWKFIEIATGSLAKAMLSDDIEQLLWNMIALEALILRKKETTQNIHRRLGLIWGEREKKKIERIRKEFNELYEFRSSLVHGSKFGEGETEKVLYRYHLRLARDYARKTVLWFICYLSHIHSELEKGAVPLDKYPKQKDLLLFLDYQMQSFEYGGAKVIMPEDFPAVSFVGY